MFVQYLEIGLVCQFASSQSTVQNCQASTQQANFACREAKYFLSKSKAFLLAVRQNVLAERKMFEKFDGGETSKQGHIVETIPCWEKSCSVLLGLKKSKNRETLTAETGH